MGAPAAKLGDQVIAVDTHIVEVPSANGTVSTPTPFDFMGKIMTGCVANVLIGGQPAAVVGCIAINLPPHIPKNGTFQTPPTNQGTIITGSSNVLAGGKPVARNGDKAMTCNDPLPLPTGVIKAEGTVFVGP
jgi:uncharacterized Zn-binding protein involved in type VI secretion